VQLGDDAAVSTFQDDADELGGRHCVTVAEVKLALLDTEKARDRLPIFPISPTLGKALLASRRPLLLSARTILNNNVPLL
jgi:hypothetical protein